MVFPSPGFTSVAGFGLPSEVILTSPSPLKRASRSFFLSSAAASAASFPLGTLMVLPSPGFTSDAGFGLPSEVILTSPSPLRRASRSFLRSSAAASASIPLGTIIIF